MDRTWGYRSWPLLN